MFWNFCNSCVWWHSSALLHFLQLLQLLQGLCLLRNLAPSRPDLCQLYALKEVNRNMLPRRPTRYRAREPVIPSQQLECKDVPRVYRIRREPGEDLMSRNEEVSGAEQVDLIEQVRVEFISLRAVGEKSLSDEYPVGLVRCEIHRLIEALVIADIGCCDFVVCRTNAQRVVDAVSTHECRDVMHMDSGEVGQAFLFSMLSLVASYPAVKLVRYGLSTAGMACSWGRAAAA